jgi:hypothetical protein
MWSCLLLTDPGGDPVVFSGVTVVPAGDPILLVDAVSRAGSGHLLVVAPAVMSTALQTGVTIATGHRPDLSLSWLTSEHAPLAILSALALARAATGEPGIGVELTRRLLAAAWSGAWTESVARLNQPNPRLSQHLRSLLPGSGFLLRQSPAPAVLGRPGPDDVPPVGLDRVLLVQDVRVPTPVTHRLSQSDGVAAVRQVALPGSWTSVYGTDRTGQLALVPADPQPLIGPVTHQCPACFLDLISPVCPFCRIVARQVAATGAVPVVTTQPVTQPVGAQPVGAQPVAVQPVAVQPVAVQPVAARPGGQPGVARRGSAGTAVAAAEQLAAMTAMTAMTPTTPTSAPTGAHLSSRPARPGGPA